MIILRLKIDMKTIILSTSIWPTFLIIFQKFQVYVLAFTFIKDTSTCADGSMNCQQVYR